MIAFNFNLQLNHQTKSSGTGSEANFWDAECLHRGGSACLCVDKIDYLMTLAQSHNRAVVKQAN